MKNYTGNPGHIYRYLRKIKIPFKVLFFIMGIVSTIWFLIRVIPKPSRAAYPCMRAAAPFMSAFVIYLSALLTTGVVLNMARKNFQKSRYLAGGVLFITAVLLAGFCLTSNPENARAGVIVPLVIHSPNNPMGEGVGIMPGRVVWAWDADATNENCTNSQDDAYFYPHNNNQVVVDQMVSGILQQLTGAEYDSAAWSDMFRYFNGEKFGEPDWDYVEHEDIFIKTNATSTWGYPGGTYIKIDFSVRPSSSYIAETNPYVVLAVLRQLVNVVGVRQQNLWVGDPMKQIYMHAYELWYNEFPDVNYIGQSGGFGRTQVVAGSNPAIFYSDKGSVMTEAVSDKIYTVMENADYMINIPTLKAHARAGITLSAKNHFGSHTRGGATHLHNGLVAPNEGPPTRTEMGQYRVQVDLMGHKLLGRNTMLVLVDGLYAGPEATYPPDKWNMAPFNGDWTSSLFASMDQVALESVCFDFLKNEYNNKSAKDSRGDSHIINFPNMAQGVDDYLEQAADPSKWPENIVYDPEDDGEPITSLGAHEHWNGAETKQYSRNLGLDVGIELIGIPAGLIEGATSVRTLKADGIQSLECYPNPFAHQLVLKFKFDEPSVAKVDIFNLQGQLVKNLAEGEFLPGEHCLDWNGSGSNGSPLPEGIYLVRISANAASGSLVESKQVQIIR
jgi:hypothetical protein